MIVDIINKKRLGCELSKEQLDYIFNGYNKEVVKDYQMSALLMAICINGMTDEEVFNLTDIFIKSGDTLDLSSIKGIKVDKHSTGGVGDKTTLIIAPIVASLGIPVVKMSGRGLGYTGGTIDKLESIKGFRTNLTTKEMLEQVNSINIVVTGATKNMVVLDKKIYALRDVTGTTSSIGLIASSIMSKKIAGGADKILIDIKVGDGALINNKKDANKLSDLMIKTGNKYNKEVRTIITDMDTPLGNSIGNSLEVLEAIDVLNGKEDNNLTKLCLKLATIMVSMGKNISEEEAEELVINSITNKTAYRKFLDMVSYQQGNIKTLKVCDTKYYLKANKDGIINKIDALELAKLSLSLGAGRITKESNIDETVGIKIKVELGEKIAKNDVLAIVYTHNNSTIEEVSKYFEII